LYIKIATAPVHRTGCFFFFNRVYRSNEIAYLLCHFYECILLLTTVILFTVVAPHSGHFKN